ncbi:DUF1622 domain-containing protein [Actinoplanes sp. NPDC023936]|uniref:DUF1622 domain-containing protein n=1 Tax=Actinoplanes sp. NPDC023936 TaxID=3154910 RepID=UPI0033C984E2
MRFHQVMEWIVSGFEITGVAILAIGSLWALLSASATLVKGDRQAAYQRARQDVGRAILLGLEVLIIADIVLTITVDRTLESALALGIIVLVRTFLSFSLEIELEGAPPWRRAPRPGTPGTSRRTPGPTLSEESSAADEAARRADP